MIRNFHTRKLIEWTFLYSVTFSYSLKTGTNRLVQCIGRIISTNLTEEVAAFESLFINK